MNIKFKNMYRTCVLVSNICICDRLNLSCLYCIETVHSLWKVTFRMHILDAHTNTHLPALGSTGWKDILRSHKLKCLFFFIINKQHLPSLFKFFVPFFNVQLAIFYRSILHLY